MPSALASRPTSLGLMVRIFDSLTGAGYCGQRPFTFLLQIFEELPRAFLNGLVDGKSGDAGKNSHKLQLHINLSLILRHRPKRHSRLQRDAREVADKLHPPPG